MGTKFNEDMKVSKGIALKKMETNGGLHVRDGGEYKPLKN